MSELRLAAVHEAGHAIAAFALGFAVERVEVACDGAGRIIYSYPWESAESPSSIERRIVVSMAGPLAEHLLGGVPLCEVAAAGDLRREADLMGRLPFSWRQSTRLRCWSRAVAMVRRHRSEIKALADRLAARVEKENFYA